MNVTLTRENLQQGLAAVIGSVPSRTTLPVLSHVLLEAEGEALHLTASDLDTTTRIRVPAEVMEAGELTLPAKKLQEIAREIGPAPVHFQRRGETMVITASRAVYRINAIAAEEFPVVPRIGFGDSRTAQVKDLLQMIAHVAFAVSDEETRPILNGVLWKVEEERMSMVATNGHRLARMRQPIQAPALVGAGSSDLSTGADLIVHPRALAQLGKVFLAEEEVEIARSENHLAFRSDRGSVITRLIKGPYPDYAAVLPATSDKVLVADKAALSQALRRAVIMAPSGTNYRIRLALRGPMLRITAQTPDLGEETEDVPVDYEGEPLEIGFNAQYLLELLKHIPSDEVRMCLQEPERAATLEPVLAGDDEIDLLYLCMPLRLLD